MAPPAGVSMLWPLFPITEAFAATASYFVTMLCSQAINKLRGSCSEEECRRRVEQVRRQQTPTGLGLSSVAPQGVGEVGVVVLLINVILTTSAILCSWWHGSAQVMCDLHLELVANSRLGGAHAGLIIKGAPGQCP